MGTTPGTLRSDAGRPRFRRSKRHRPVLGPPDLIEQAMNRPGWGEEISAKEWELLRVPTWERWLDQGREGAPPHA